jgi:serine/threonine-protein kinase RsbW
MTGFTATIEGNMLFLTGLRRDFGSWLAVKGIPDSVRKSTVLATHEAVANAIEHASPGGSVVVKAVVDLETITVSVTDTGTQVWSPPSPDSDRGRGLMLIHGLGDRVRIRTDVTGTTIQIVMPARERVPAG